MRNTGTLGITFFSPAVLLISFLTTDASLAAPRDCDKPTSEVEIIDCLPFQVRDTDSTLNDLYNRLLKTRSAAQIEGLRLSQRDWLGRRDRYCHLSSEETDRDVWIAMISRDYAKAACVVLFTTGRISELRKLDQTSTTRKTSTAAQTASNRTYPAVQSTWGAVLNPTNEAPIGKFKVFYFDSRQPHTVVTSSTVDDVSINYNGSEFHKINSKHFGAYWVGRMQFPKKTSKVINIGQGWSKTRIIIDKTLVYEGGSNARVPYVFSEGEHLVEVQYLNNWHTTEFLIDFADESPLLSITEIRQALENPRYRTARILYAGLYESSSRNLSTSILLMPTEEPIVLVLSSYSPVKWNIRNPHNVDVRAVVLGSHSPGSKVIGDLNDSVSVLPLKGRIGSYKTLPKCRCDASGFSCSGGNLKSTILRLEQATGLHVLGLSGRYSAASLVLPEQLADEESLAKVESSLEQQAKERIVCTRQGNPDFDYLLNRPQ